MTLSVQRVDDFGISLFAVQTRSCLVHVNSAYATSVHRQCNFSTQSVHQEYDFGTCLDRYQVSAYKIIVKAKN